MASIGTEDSVERIANSALTKFRFVNILTSDSSKIELTGVPGDNDVALGVVAADAASGEHASVKVSGVVKIEAEAAIAINALIASGTAGKGKTAVAGNHPRARALKAAAAAGDIIEVLLIDQAVV